MPETVVWILMIALTGHQSRLGSVHSTSQTCVLREHELYKEADKEHDKTTQFYCVPWHVFTPNEFAK